MKDPCRKYDAWNAGRCKETGDWFVYRVVSDSRVSWIEWYLLRNGHRALFLASELAWAKAYELNELQPAAKKIMEQAWANS